MKLDHRVEGGEPETPPGGKAGLGDHEQSVVAARAQTGHGPHRVATETVGDQPLARGGRVKIAAKLRPEPNHAGILPDFWTMEA